jgi:hypothetical protein
MTRYASECTLGQILNFQNIFDRACEEIRLEIQIKNFLQKFNLNEISLVVTVWQLDLQLPMQSVPREFESHSGEVN